LLACLPNPGIWPGLVIFEAAFPKCDSEIPRFLKKRLIFRLIFPGLAASFLLNAGVFTRVTGNLICPYQG
jgi:hypothetical protein